MGVLCAANAKSIVVDVPPHYCVIIIGVTAGVKMYANCRFENAGKIGSNIPLAG